MAHTSITISSRDTYETTSIDGNARITTHTGLEMRGSGDSFRKLAAALLEAADDYDRQWGSTPAGSGR